MPALEGLLQAAVPSVSMLRRRRLRGGVAVEIFISYRRADQAWARLLVQLLQAEGVEAWYDAHVEAGEDWRVATAKALESSKIFVLLFSDNAAQSSDIAKELAAAVLEKKHIVPIRLQNIAPKGAFLYELASRNWINAYDNTEQRLGEIAKGLAHMVRTGARDQSALPFERQEDKVANRKLFFRAVVGIAACLVAALSLYIGLRPSQQLARTNKVTPAVSGIQTQTHARPSGISIAVLPFLNLSADKSQDFFSDGMTEEITSALAKVPGLTVIGRTSAFQFKGENRDMRAIGKALGASNLIEGSVRKDGDDVRITAQLIRAEDGTHLWTDSYDRKLKKIFVVQEEIATAIAGAMQVPLGLKQGESLITNRTEDTISYQDFLRAQALFRARKNGEVVTLMKKVLARDPNYAPGWALLSKAYGSPVVYAPLQDAVRAGNPAEARRFLQSQLDSMEQAARKAIGLDPRNAEAYASLGSHASLAGHWVEGMDYTRKALALDPNNPDTLYSYGYLLAATGFLKEAMQVQSQIIALEPFVPVYRGRGADLLWALGKNDEALALQKSAAYEGARLAKIYATKGQYAQAADALLAIPPAPLFPRELLTAAARVMRSAPAKIEAPDSLPLLPGNLSFVYLFIGEDSRSLDFVEREIDVGYYGGIFRDPWAPPSAKLRKTQRFKDFVRKARLVDYWRARGWPQYCHPVGADDFACN